jgi:hypothetical protein
MHARAAYSSALAAAVSVSALLGCVAPTDEARCGAMRPSIAGCVRGLYWADCGGGGETTLACSESDGSCLWFSGDCVALGYRPIRCPREDVCCETSSAGAWPYPDDWRPADMTQRLAEDVALFGSTPITRDSPAPIEVLVDPELVAPDSATATCTGGLDLQLCDDPASFPIMTPEVTQVGDAIVVRLRNRFRHVQDLIVEIVPRDDGSGTAIARAFLRLRSDLLREEPVCAIDYVDFPEQTGAMVVSTGAPSGSEPLHAQLTLTLGDRGTLVLRF